MNFTLFINFQLILHFINHRFSYHFNFNPHFIHFVQLLILPVKRSHLFLKAYFFLQPCIKFQMNLIFIFSLTDQFQYR